MYHVALHLGNLFHAHPVDRRRVDPLGTLKRCISSFTVSTRQPQQHECDDLAHQRLGAEVKRELSGSATDQVVSTSNDDDDDDESRWGLDETWLSLP
jgi:hypothetical protein